MFDITKSGGEWFVTRELESGGVEYVHQDPNKVRAWLKVKELSQHAGVAPGDPPWLRPAPDPEQGGSF